MALANEMVLDLTEALKKAEQMDEHLTSWVNKSNKVTRNLKEGLQDAISNLKSQLDSINGNGIGNIGGQATQSIDDVNELLASLRQLSEAYSQLKEHKGSVIDFGDTTKRIKELEDRISAINKMLKDGEDENKNSLTPKQQQTLVDERAVLSQQLRIQQQSIEQKIALEEKNLKETLNLVQRYANQEEEERYRLTLARMQKEQEAQKRNDDENFARQKQNIEKQNELYAQQARQEAAKEQQKRDEIAEYDKIIQKLKELYATKNKADQVKGDFNYSSTLRSDASQVSDDALKQIQELNRRRFELENKLQGELDDVKAKHREKDFKESVKIAEDIAKEEERIAKKTAQEEAKNRKDAAKALEEFKRKTPKDASYLLGLKGQQKSLDELKKYVDELKKTMNSLDPKSKEWKKLNVVLNESNKKIENIRESMGDLNSKSSNLLNISEQLTRRLALVFSVSQVTGYVKKLASVRGEFELQQKSLAAIIQNKDKANEIFDKVTKLAVQSPFQLQELVTYTKQLAAYRIETNKLYDSTKMLADISAGVGVDMDRLVLAYGQVAAANYLRGTELRQFSEAGVNVLGELANYFTELKGRVVEVDEVFEMVSRRMVRFEDVDAVLRRMTQSGGEFYNMQAVQAQTLKGQISNLKDSIEIMLNDIGTAQEGVLKGSVALVREFAENWRHVANALISVSVAIGGIALAHFAKQIQDGAWALTKLGKAVTFVTGNWSKLATLMKSGAGVFGWVGIVIAAATAVWRLHNAFKAANKKYEEMSVTASNQIQVIKGATKNYNEATEAIKALNEQIAELESEGKTETEAYTKAVEDLNTAKKAQSKAINKLKSDFPDLFATIKKNTDGTYDLTEATEKYNQALRTKIALEQSSKGKFLAYEDVQTNASDALKYLSKSRGKLAKVSNEIHKEITKLESEYANATTEAQKKDIELRIANLQTIQDFLLKEGFEENYKQLDELKNSWGVSFNLKDDLDLLVDSFRTTFQKIDADLLGTNFNNMSDIIEFQWRQIGKIDSSTNEGKQQALNFLKGMYSQFGVEDSTLQRMLKDKLETLLKFDFDLVLGENGGSDKDASAWREAVIDELTEVYNTIPELTDKVTQELMKVTDEEGNNVLDGFKIDLPTESADYYEYIKEFQLAWDKILDLQERAHGKDQALFTDDARATIDKTTSAYNKMAGIMGLVKDKSKSTDDVYSEQIRVLKELHKSYIDLNDIFGEFASKEGAVEKFGKAFKEAFNVDIDTYWEGLKDIKGLQLDFTTEEGIVAAFDKLIARIPNESKRVQAELAKSEFIMEYRIQAKKDADQRLKDEVQKFFDDYEMKIELDKLGVSGDAANALFGIESIDLDELRERLTLKRGEFIGRDMIDEYKAFQDKLTEMEVKAQEERLKKYLGNIRDNISDRAKLKIEELQKLKEIEDSFVAKEGASDEEKQAIKTAKKLAIEGLKESTKQQLQKMDWEDFQKSDYFISMFDDLDNASSMAINSMITQLENYKDQWTDMPLDDMKKVIDLINKLKDAADEKITNPFYAAKKTEREIAEYGRSKSESESDFETFTDMSNYEEEQARLYEQALIAKTKILTVEEQEQMLGKENMHLLSMSSEELAQQRDYHKGLSKDYKNQASLAQQQLQRYAKLTNQYEKQAQVLADIRGTFNNLVGAATELGEALGMDEMSKMWTEIGGNVFDTGLAIAEGVLGLKAQKLELDENATAAEMFGYKMNMALGIIGYIVMAIQLVAKIITAIVKAHDDNLQKQIERDAEAVELLQKRYEKLEEAIDNAMSFGEYQQAFDEGKRNLEEQIRLTERMIALEEDKKKTDKDAIKGYKDEIEDYNEQLKEMEEKRIEDMGGFGSQEAIKDAAEGFIDAWADAYNETGDGLDALKDKWDEYFNNLLKKQMMMKVASKYMEKVLEEINTAIKDDILTGEEMEKLKTIKDESSEQLNAIMKQFAEGMGWEGGLGGGSELDGLSESIQGVTEVTAQALEAILNSMRFYVIDNNTQQKRIVEIMESWEVSNPMLSELRTQTTIIDNIYNLFYSVVDHSTKSIRTI